MNTILKNLSEVTAKADDIFTNKFTDVDNLMGIMDKTLRKQGMKADAITIDCIPRNKKIVIVLHDEKPDVVDIALGNKAGDVFSSSQYDVNKLTDKVVADIMEDYLMSA